MKLISKTEETIKTVTTVVEDGRTEYIIKDFLNESGKVIDTVITVNDEYVEDPFECNRVLEFIDSLEE